MVCVVSLFVANQPRWGVETLNDAQILSRTAGYVRDTMLNDCPGHDWWHVWRVRNIALHIARAESANRLVVELTALLHDIADWKFHGGDETAGPKRARAWLNELQVDTGITDHVCDIIGRLSFRGAAVRSDMPTLEGQVVQDADRLDAMGAIGVARAFAYGGGAGRAIHEPGLPPEQHDSFAAYKQSTGPTVNHFYEKLLLLKDRLNTGTGRELASQRHCFLERFLEQFQEEWEFAASNDIDDSG